MRKLFSALLLTLVTTNASALSTETRDLLATIAMPLAVAAVSRVTGVQQIIPGTQTEVTPFDSGYFDNSTVSGSTLDVIALPLAVAAASDINGVPQDQLASLIAALNQANMPPNQMIEVVRYVPVALVDDPQPFVQYVQQQTSRGVTGAALYPLVARRLQPYYPTTQITLAAPPPAPVPQRVVVNRTPLRAREYRRPVVVDQNFFPPVVVNRTAEVRQHPHGGPPGQLKKQYGLQTGARVMHVQPAGAQPAPVAVPQVAPPAAAPIAAAPARGNGRGPEGQGPPGQNKDKEHGKDKGNGKD